jgi:NADH dehydrogenase (ubiquinone) Fe-S protein 3
VLTSIPQGYTEIRYDEERKRVVYEPLQMTQAFRFAHIHFLLAQISTDFYIHRNFEALSPWEQVGEGSHHNRPDELKPAKPQPEAAKK